MANTQIAVRKDTYRRLRRLPDDKILKVLDLINDLEEYEPNEETIRVIEDARAGRNLLGPYDNLSSMFKDFGIDVDAKSN